MIRPRIYGFGNVRDCRGYGLKAMVSAAGGVVVALALVFQGPAVGQAVEYRVVS